MSRIDQLITELCPAGVTKRPLSEIGQLVRGNGLPKVDFAETGVGAIHYGQIYTHYGTWATETISFVEPEKALRLAKVDPGDVIITNTSENLDDVCKAVAWLGDEQVVTGGHATVFKHSQNPKFIAYWLQTAEFHAQKKRLATGTKVIDVSAKALEKVKIPIPPMAIQDEIVSVLDDFTALEGELEAELKVRRRQYAFYRDTLLSLDDDECELLTLSAVSLEFGRGKSRHRPRNDPKLFGGTYPFIQTGDVRNSGHLITNFSQTYNEDGLTQSKLWPRGTVCITIAANIAETGILDFDSCFPDSVIGMVVDPRKTSAHFVEYLLQSFKFNLAAKGRGSAQANINLATFEHELFPFPPLERQQRIVGMLDKLDALVSDLHTGLPAELHARRKQFEHYRDKLLAFKEATA